MTNSTTSFEELLIQVVLFLDDPTLLKAIALDKKWQELNHHKKSSKVIGPWVKAYLHHNIFSPQIKIKKTLTPNLKSNIHQPASIPAHNIMNVLVQPESKETHHPVLKLLSNNNNKKDLPLYLLVCAIAPTAAFIMAESLTHDFEASLFAAAMMFGTGTLGVLLGGFHCCKYIEDMSLDLMIMLIGRIRQKERRKILNGLFASEDENTEFQPSPENAMRRPTLRPMKTTIF